VPHPTDPDVAWIGAVNGGVWKTTNATSSSPSWTPLTDHMPSLAIGALELDPTDASHSVLVAGTGNWSSFSGGIGGPLTGILRSTDGGSTWEARGDDLAGENISGLAPRGNVIVVASKAGQGGIWRSTDDGLHFDRLTGQASSGLSSGLAYDLAGDPSDVNRLYAAIGGASGGVYQSDDLGATWSRVGAADFDGQAASGVLGNADNMKVSVHASDATGAHVVYAAVDNAGALAGLFRRSGSGSWQALDQPSTIDSGTTNGLQPGTQGRIHLSMVADPEDASLVYLGGDRRPQGDGLGRLFRCDSSKAAGSQCTQMTVGDTTDDSGPHPDSRDMHFDATGDVLLETDDGGIFRRTNPRSSGGQWTSINGNLAITEAHACAYDNVSDLVLCGTQDNGEPEQSASDSEEWTMILPFDGGIVGAVGSGSYAVRYYSTKNLSQFTRAVCLPGNACTSTVPALIVDGGAALSTVDPNLPLYTPTAAHAVDPLRVVVANTAVYESTDGGQNLTTLSGFGGTATRAIAYGTAGNPDALYVGSSSGLFVRTTASGALSATAYSDARPAAVVMDPGNAASVWVVDSNNVWHGTGYGGTWSDVTGDLAAAGAGKLFSIAFIPGSSASIIAVGADNGLYVTNTAQLGQWSKVEGTLPNVTVYDLDYDATDDLLLISTLGRGAWTMPQASEMNLPPSVELGADATSDEGATFIRTGTFSDPNGSTGATATVDYGDGLGAQPLPLGSGTFTLSHAYADDGSYTITVVVTDAAGATGSDTMKVTVVNVPPAITSFTVAPTPAALGTVVNAFATFTDPGILDTHTATLRWGDGTGAQDATVGGTNTDGTVSGSHLYATPGVYTVTLTVTDKDDGEDSAIYQYAVIYDPDGGFVTGGGWITSPPNGFLPNPSLTGKASFGFVSRYHKGQSIPQGNTSFQLHSAGFHFSSTSYEWLVVAGAKAQYKGAGTVNGVAGYGFWLSAVDGDLKGGGAPDTFRIKVWEIASGAVIYDSQRGDSDTANPVTALGGGSIVIHP